MSTSLVLLLLSAALAAPLTENLLETSTWRHSSDDLMAVFQEPPNNKEPQGVLLLFHGCTHNAEDWFELPAERIVVQEALERGLVCVALPSADRVGSRCWDLDVDDERVEKIMREFVQPTWPTLPLYAAGASSGGSFAAWLGNNAALNIKGLALYITPGLPDFLELTETYPRTAMIVMNEDHHSATIHRAETFIERLASQRVSGKVWTCSRKNLSPTFFKLHTPSWSPQLRATLLRNLHRAKLVNDKGFLLKNPRDLWDQHMELLQNTAEQLNTSTTDMDVESLREILNIAWGEHEMTGEHAGPVLDFLLRRTSRR
eukprot:m.244089 g.244089  ORF g.244089 m.244089 type:complete len:316 (+) comp29544_c0_seq1:145-1092(+)